MKNFNPGQYLSQGSYNSFEPDKINRQWKIEDMELLTMLSQADRQLGRLDMYSEYIPNIDMFIKMHVVKEATQSSKIEGTKTNIEEALLGREDVNEEKKGDWDEVQNYITALDAAVDSLKTLPFSSRLIKQTHKKLLKGVRGEFKSPGQFRTSQNWIGGANINDATFVPPVYTSINALMGDLENFAHNDKFYFPELLKIALIHYQFETIHPFLDGNGRVGRLMITLYLVETGILKKPILYLSDFFEKHRSLYYDNLMRAREKKDIIQWFKFFLLGVIETAKSSINTFDKILKLQKEVEAEILTLGNRSHKAQQLLENLYRNPVVDAQKVKAITNLSLPTVYKILDELEGLNILKELTGGKRGKLFLFHRYTDLFK